MSEREEIILRRISETVKSVDPTAQVILYGSRARGSAKKDSDWDILILIDKPKVTLKDEQLFRYKLLDIEIETGEAISTFAYAVKEWNTKMSVTPLYQSVKNEGIIL